MSLHSLRPGSCRCRRAPWPAQGRRPAGSTRRRPRPPGSPRPTPSRSSCAAPEKAGSRCPAEASGCVAVGCRAACRACGHGSRCGRSGTIAGPLVPTGADQAFHVGLHQQLHHGLSHAAQEVAIPALAAARPTVICPRSSGPRASGEASQLHLSLPIRWPPQLAWEIPPPGAADANTGRVAAVSGACAPRPVASSPRQGQTEQAGASTSS